MASVLVDDLPALFDSWARDVMREHEKRFTERARAIREASSGVDSAASRFEAAVKSAWGTMDKSASEYATRMARTIQDLTRTLSRKQIPETYHEADTFHKESVDALNRIIKTVRKYVPKLRRGLRVEMAALNVSLGKLESAVKALGSALDKSPGNKIEPIRRNVLYLKQVNADLLTVRAENAEKQKLLEAEELRENDAAKKLEAFTSNGMFLELTNYEASLKAKEEEIKQFLQPVSKPLSKLQRTAAAEKNQTINVNVLRGLIENPVETVIETQPFVLIQLFNHLGDALARGGIEVEERRRRKAEETVEQIRQGSLQKLRGDCLTIQANVQETLRQLRAKGLLDKKETLDRNLEMMREEVAKLTGDMTEIRRRIEALTTTITKEKASVEHEIAGLTGKRVDIQTG